MLRGLVEVQVRDCFISNLKSVTHFTTECIGTKHVNSPSTQRELCETRTQRQDLLILKLAHFTIPQYYTTTYTFCIDMIKSSFIY